jgi:hypothetical protein
MIAVRQGTTGRLNAVVLAITLIAGCSTPPPEPTAVPTEMPTGILDESQILAEARQECSMGHWSLLDPKQVSLTLVTGEGVALYRDGTWLGPMPDAEVDSLRWQVALTGPTVISGPSVSADATARPTVLGRCELTLRATDGERLSGIHGQVVATYTPEELATLVPVPSTLAPYPAPTDGPPPTSAPYP